MKRHNFRASFLECTVRLVGTLTHPEMQSVFLVGCKRKTLAEI